MRILPKLNTIDCCQTTTKVKLIYFPTNAFKQQKHLGSSKFRFLKSALLGKIHAFLQDFLTCSPISNNGIAGARPNMNIKAAAYAKA